MSRSPDINALTPRTPKAGCATTPRDRWARLSLRARAFLLWLVVVTAAPGLAAAWAEALGVARWSSALPYLCLALAVLSLFVVSPPGTNSPSAWLEQLRARLAAETAR